jgi:hypothetical protein
MMRTSKMVVAPFAAIALYQPGRTALAAENSLVGGASIHLTRNKR